MAQRIIVPGLVAMLALVVALVPAVAQQNASFTETFDGTPPAPATYTNPAHWSIFVQGFNAQEATAGATVAQHGPNCEPPGFPYTATNTHVMHSATDAVFLCNGHVMTSLGVTGYGAVYMTPPAMLDFSQGSATIRWDMSTLRTSARDWVDVVLTPWAEHSDFAYNNNDQHIPPHNIHVTLAGTNVWQAFERIGGGIQYGQGQDVQLAGDGSTTWDDVFRRAGTTESPARRDTFEIRLSRTTLSVCMPGYDSPAGGVFCWINTTLPEPLEPAVWGDQATVMLSHRTYNAEKACNEDNGQPQPWTDQLNINHTAYGDLNCPPDTWHWDNVAIQPFVPYLIIPAVPSDAAITAASGGVVTFAQPAPSGAALSFVQFSHTPDLRVSYDAGHTWIAPRIQPAIAPNNGASEENGESVFDPIPAGVQQVMVRGSNGFWGTFDAEAFRIVGPPSSGLPVPTPLPTATSVPATPTSTPGPSATPAPRPTGVPATLTPGPTVDIPPTVQPTPEATRVPAVSCQVLVFQDGIPKLVDSNACAPNP